MKNTNLIIGKTNTGKTKGILFNEVNNMIENDENLLIVDNREEYYETYSKKLKEKGYNTYVINLNNPLKSNGYNPLMLPYNLYKNGNKDDSVELIKNLCSEIFKDNSADPFWSNMSSDYVTGLILTIFKNAKEEEINFGSLAVILNQADQKYEDTSLLNAYLNSLDVFDNIYISTSPTAFSPVETRGSIVSVVKQKLNMFFMKENLMNMLSLNEIDLENINNKTAIFVIGNNNIANIFINQLFYAIKNNKIKFNIILDNIDSFSTILCMNELVENATYNNIKLYVSSHDISGLENIYGKYITTKFENIINLPNDELKLIEVGNDNEYPIIKEQEKHYFNFEEFIKNK